MTDAPVQDRGAQSRDAILDTAGELMARHGYAATSAMTATQSLMPMTTSMSCSTKHTVSPSSRSRVMCPSSDWVDASPYGVS
jgi:hypothetical protein